jgi:hypothetical protein
VVQAKGKVDPQGTIKLFEKNWFERPHKYKKFPRSKLQAIFFYFTDFD